MEGKQYPIFEVMTLSEAAILYGVNIETLKSRFKGSKKGKEQQLERWENGGLARKSGATWLVTKDFMELEYGTMVFIKKED